MQAFIAILLILAQAVASSGATACGAVVPKGGEPARASCCQQACQCGPHAACCLESNDRPASPPAVPVLPSSLMLEQGLPGQLLDGLSAMTEGAAVPAGQLSRLAAVPPAPPVPLFRRNCSSLD